MKLINWLLIALLFQASICYSQTVAEKQWFKIESSQKDFSVSLPEGFLVDSEIKKNKLYFSQDDTYISIEFDNPRNPKDYFNDVFSEAIKIHPNKYSFFKSGDFLTANYFETNKDNDKSASFTLASSRGYYNIYIRTTDLDVYQKFISKIKIEGTPLLKTKTVDFVEKETLSVVSLKTSDIILEALKQSDNRQKKAEMISEEDKKYQIENTGFSRPLIILRKPRSKYPEYARSGQIQGTAKLFVSFLANGQIGEIKIVEKLNGLEIFAFDAAKKIKFVPAERNGKPIDLKRYLEYTFTLY